MASLSAIFGLLGSPFIAVLQIIVYAGAIMVLFVFVLMLLNVKEEQRLAGRQPRLPVGGAGPGHAAGRAAGGGGGARHARGPGLGRRASTPPRARWRRCSSPPQYLYVFEATSVLIVAALVGALVLARKPDHRPGGRPQ